MPVQIEVAILFNNIPRLIGGQLTSADLRIGLLAREGQEFVKESFGTSPPGKVRSRRFIAGGDHTASQPGYPPNIDTGRLKRSIAVRKDAPLQWAVATDVPYSVHLEFGTFRMAPRPFMGPMAVEIEKRVPSKFRGFLEAEGGSTRALIAPTTLLPPIVSGVIS